MDDQHTRLSKTLAYLLRHQPDAVGIKLDTHGWVEVSTLVTAMVTAGHAVTEADVERIVQQSDKQRYELDSGRIRAAQGHSVDVELGIDQSVPPDVLYHGTVARVLDQIHDQGLRPQGRSHVHLSADASTARSVGQRRGKPIILKIDAARMVADGYNFVQATNGVWLTATVPPAYFL